MYATDTMTFTLSILACGRRETVRATAIVRILVRARCCNFGGLFHFFWSIVSKLATFPHLLAADDGDGGADGKGTCFQFVEKCDCWDDCSECDAESDVLAFC